MIRDSASQALSSVVPSGPLAGERSGCASFLHLGLTNALDGSEDDLINIRHPAVDARRRRGLPCSPPARLLRVAPRAAFELAPGRPGATAAPSPR